MRETLNPLPQALDHKEPRGVGREDPRVSNISLKEKTWPPYYYLLKNPQKIEKKNNAPLMTLMRKSFFKNSMGGSYANSSLHPSPAPPSLPPPWFLMTTWRFMVLINKLQLQVP